MFGISKFVSSKLWETSWLLSKFFVELHPSEHSPGAPAPTPQPAPAVVAPAPPAPGGLLDLDLDFTVRSGFRGGGIYPQRELQELQDSSHQNGKRKIIIDSKRLKVRRRDVIVPRKVLFPSPTWSLFSPRGILYVDCNHSLSTIVELGHSLHFCGGHHSYQMPKWSGSPSS